MEFIKSPKYIKRLFKNKFLFRFLVILSTFGLILFFQNCSKISVQVPSKIEEPIVQQRQKPGFELCPVADTGQTSDRKLIFVLDMSMSNLGVVGDPGFPAYCGGRGLYNIDMSSGTDLNGLRFDAIRTFLSQISGGSGMGYSVIGFSNDAILGDASQTCSRSIILRKEDILGTASEPNSGYLTKLQRVQEGDRNQSGSCSPNGSYPFDMKLTSYYSAFDCLSKAIDGDLVYNENSPPFYQIFFVTDGKPDERLDSNSLNISKICGSGVTACSQALNNCKNMQPGCVNLNDCYVTSPAVQMCVEEYLTNSIYKSQLQTVINKIQQANAGYKFKPIFYSKAPTTPEEENEINRARTLLNVLAQADGSGTEALTLTNLQDLSAEFSEALGIQATSSYIFNMPTAFNLNAVPVGKNVELDTDMDGVTDSKEDNLGWDKQNPRSQGILDGLCYHFFEMYGNDCAPVDQTLCQNPLGFGLSECDRDKMKELVPHMTLTGGDTDQDGIIDYVEIIRGTNPLFSDLNLDDDRDGLKNTSELANGSDYKSLLPMTTGQTMSVEGSRAPMFGECAFNGMGVKAKIDKSSFVDGALGYSSGAADIFSQLNYEQNKNIVLVTVWAETVGSVNVKRALYVAILKLNSNGSYSQLEVGNDMLIKVGEF